jgi:hypothetical protein
LGQAPDSIIPPPPQLQSTYQCCPLDAHELAVSCLPLPTTFSALEPSATLSALLSSLIVDSLCDAKCTSIFTGSWVVIRDIAGNTILQGPREE